MTETGSAFYPERLLVGTLGWAHDHWGGIYYPEELPEEWRLAYYCNDFRSTLVPADHWRDAPAAALGELAGEIDAGFSVVLGLPEEGPGGAGLTTGALPGLLQPIGERLRALSWRPAPHAAAGEMADVARLAERWPLVLDYGEDHPQQDALHALRAAAGASRLWRPQSQEAPEQEGSFLLALAADPDLPLLRRTLEQIDRWMGGGRDGGLFLEPTTRAPELAKQCRILTELLEL